MEGKVREISQFVQVESSTGKPYFIGHMSGIRVGLISTGQRDADGNPIWNLVAHQHCRSRPTHEAELLQGGCVVFKLKTGGRPASGGREAAPSEGCVEMKACRSVPSEPTSERPAGDTAPTSRTCEVCNINPPLGALRRCRQCIKIEADASLQSRRDAEIRAAERTDAALEAAGRVKHCRGCREVKPFSQFQIRRAANDGHRHDCKVCVSAGKPKRPPTRETGLPPELVAVRSSLEREGVLA